MGGMLSPRRSTSQVVQPLATRKSATLTSLVRSKVNLFEPSPWQSTTLCLCRLSPPGSVGLAVAEDKDCVVAKHLQRTRVHPSSVVHSTRSLPLQQSSPSIRIVRRGKLGMSHCVHYTTVFITTDLL